MSHLHLVPALPAAQCECGHSYGRYWHQGEWACKATDQTVRWYPTKGWHHYAGPRVLAFAFTFNLPVEQDIAA